MGNCCRGESSTQVLAGDDRRARPPKKHHRHRKHSDNGEAAENNLYSCRDERNGSASSSSCTTTNSQSPKGGSLRELKIRMTKKELEELVGWLNMADSSFEQVMARLVNVISEQRGDEEDDDEGEVVRLRQQRSWRPSLQSIPEIN